MLQRKPQQSDTSKCPHSRFEKVPCWELLGCSKYVRQRCDVYLRPEIPCWDRKLTACEIVLKILKDCKHCIVYERNHYRNPHNGAVSG